MAATCVPPAAAVVTPHIGYVGCSMGRNTHDGWNAINAEAWPGFDTGGQTTQTWADLSAPVWGRYQTMLDTYPATNVIVVQLCRGKAGSITLAMVQTVVEEVRRRTPGAAVYITYQPEYVSGHLCNILANSLTAQEAALQNMRTVREQAISAGVALRGRDLLGPLDPAWHLTDACHASATDMDGTGPQVSGKHFLGSQMNDWWTSLGQTTTTTTQPTTTTQATTTTTATTIPPTTTTTQPPSTTTTTVGSGVPEDVIVSLGCTMTMHATAGYHTVGGTKLTNGAANSATIDLLAKPTGQKWNAFNQAIAGVVEEAVWFQVCTSPSTATTYSQAVTVIKNIRSRVGTSIPTYIGWQPEYAADGNGCGSNGNSVGGPNVSRAYARQLVAEGYGVADPSPITLTDAMLRADCTNANNTGQRHEGMLLLGFLG